MADNENMIHIQVMDPGLFIEDSLKTTDGIDGKEIRAVSGKLKSDPDGFAPVQEYRFAADKFSQSEAEKWVHDHSRRPGMERRSFDSMVAYSKEDHNVVRLRGLAIPYSQLSNNPIQGMPGMKERILPGAFKRSLESGKDVMMLWNHELKYIFGRTTRGTLKLNEKTDGVHFENDPPDSGWSRDLLPSIKRGDYSNMSFGFTEDVKPYHTLENGSYVRNVSQATLHEISLVPNAVYETTSIGARSAEFMMVDGLLLPDPSAQQRMAEQELDNFKEIEAKFNNLKNHWLK